MLKFKSLSLLLLALGSSTGAAYSAPTFNVSNIGFVQQNGLCKGIVKDTTGETIIGASVIVKGTQNGTITGLDGDFSLSGVSKGTVLQISFVGYKTQEVTWNGTPLNVILQDDTQKLDEVVVVGFGTQKKRLR